MLQDRKRVLGGVCCGQGVERERVGGAGMGGG